MATSLNEINAQLTKLEAEAATLRRQADELRNKERSAVIDDLMKKIAEYGLTAADLRFSTRAVRGKKATPAKAPAKYRGPNGEEWSGGRGRKPAWVTAALLSGKSISDFEIK